LTLLIGGFFFILTNDKLEVLDFENNCERFFLYGAVGIFAILVILTIIFLLLMFHNIKHKYQYLPLPEYLYNRQDLLFNHYKENHPEHKESKQERRGIKYAKEQFHIETLEYYVDCATNNQKVNDERLKYYYWSRKFLMFSVIALILIITIILINKS